MDASVIHKVSYPKEYDTHTKRADIKYTVNEGDDWRLLTVHSVETPDGAQWDAVNGWRKPNIYFPDRPCGPTKSAEFSGPPDPVYQPAHYARWPMQPIEFITINDKEGWYCRGNVIKYVMRYDAKNVLEDLYKARSYLDMLIRKEEGVERFWEQPVAAERKANGKA